MAGVTIAEHAPPTHVTDLVPVVPTAAWSFRLERHRSLSASEECNHELPSVSCNPWNLPLRKNRVKLNREISRATDNTIAYYDANVDKYVRESVGTDMECFYAAFLSLVPARGSLLDLGCGTGRDTKAFLARGYQVTAIDGSKRMVDATTRLTGQPAIHMRFQEVAFKDKFDGIWACASLLHVSRDEFTNVLHRLERALRPQGVCYMSFKEGHGERVDGGRCFTYFTGDELCACLARETSLAVHHIWLSDDPRPRRSERWVNLIANATHPRDSPPSSLNHPRGCGRRGTSHS